MLVYQIYQLIIWDIIMPTGIPINFPCATLFQVVLVLYQQLLPCMPDFSGCFQGINAAAQPKKRVKNGVSKTPVFRISLVCLMAGVAQPQRFFAGGFVQLWPFTSFTSFK